METSPREAAVQRIKLDKLDAEKWRYLLLHDELQLLQRVIKNSLKINIARQCLINRLGKFFPYNSSSTK